MERKIPGSAPLGEITPSLPPKKSVKTVGYLAAFLTALWTASREMFVEMSFSFNSLCD
jgi:hypothetical protein